MLFFLHKLGLFTVHLQGTNYAGHSWPKILGKYLWVTLIKFSKQSPLIFVCIFWVLIDGSQ